MDKETVEMYTYMCDVYVATFVWDGFFRKP